LNPADFRAPSAGTIVQAPGGYSAFVPAPLPPPLVYDPDLVLGLSRADAALSELSGLSRQLPTPHLLIAPYLRREAVLSSRIEGTRASLSDLLLDEAEEGQPADADVQEVRNYVEALEYGLARLDALPLSLRLVRELHERLMHGVRGEHATPGELRRSGVERTAREALGQARRLISLHDTLRERLRQRPNTMALLDQLFVNPYITVSRAARLLNVSYPTARSAVTRLQQEGLLEEVTGRSWGRLYLARPILDAIENR
jgi:Fic family protein